MAGRSRSRSEGWWKTSAPPHVLRCVGHYKSTGARCRRVAVDGSVVCDQHGGAAGQTIRRAAERVQMTADDAAQKLVEWMNDTSVDMRERVKIAHDLMDRSGLGAAQVHKIMPIQEDPIEKLFSSLLDQPGAFLDPEPALLALPSAEPLVGFDEEDSDTGLVGDVPPASPAPPSPAPRSPLTPPKHIRDALGDLI